MGLTPLSRKQRIFVRFVRFVVKTSSLRIKPIFGLLGDVPKLWVQGAKGQVPDPLRGPHSSVYHAPYNRPTHTANPLWKVTTQPIGQCREYSVCRVFLLSFYIATAATHCFLNCHRHKPCLQWLWLVLPSPTTCNIGLSPWRWALRQPVLSDRCDSILHFCLQYMGCPSGTLASRLSHLFHQLVQNLV